MLSPPNVLQLVFVLFFLVPVITLIFSLLGYAFIVFFFVVVVSRPPSQPRVVPSSILGLKYFS